MMKCCKKSKPPGAYKYKEQDLPEIFRTCRPPPPPPPGEELWELQFCRWWGWNWVKKRDDLGGPGGRPSLENERQNRRQVQQQQYRCNEDPRVMERRPPYNGGNMGARCSPTRCNNDRQMMMNSRPPYGRVERRVEKKHIKQLCNCLCFKKKPQGISSLQNMYSTPSNSVVMHETYTCGVVHNQDSVARLEVERNISRKGRRETCRCKCSQAQPWMNVKEESESSDEGIDCQCCGKANKSSTEDSIEVLNIQCQCCCKPQCSKTPPRPQINNNHTQTNTGQKAEMVQTANCGCVCGTQTQNVKQASKSTKKKRQLVVCCHCCCHCVKDDVRGGEDVKVQANPDSFDNVGPPQKPGGGGGKCRCIAAANNYTPAVKESPVTDERNASFDYAAAKESPVSDERNASLDYDDEENKNGGAGNDYDVYRATVRQGKINPIHLKQFKPWDAALYQQKAFPKYGAPSKNYPWVQRTTSDILDKYYKLKISEEFSSPVTGKTYNLSPMEVPSLGGASIKSSLPEPIEVKEDIQYLEKLETNAKHDIPSRIMLNAMCDAILYNNVDADCPSILLSEFTYLDKDGGAGGGCTKNNCSSTHCAELPRDSSNNSTQTQVADDNAIRQHVEETVKKLLQEKEERLGASDDRFKEHIERVGLQKAFNQEDDDTEEIKEENPEHKSRESLNNFGSKQHCCFRAHEEHSIVPRFYPTFTKTGLLPSICPYKRSASPASNGQVKKSRPCLDGGDSMVQNVNDLLDKIDEIALRSQENDQKVQNVLHSIGNPDQIHVERTSGFHMNFETSLSGEMSSTDIFRKIDEIVQRSQLNNNKIQNVLNIIPKTSNSPRDYLPISHQGPPCISSEDGAVMKTERLSSISEVPQETTEDVKVKSSTSVKLEVPTNAPSGKKKKKGGTLKSLIPIKQKNKNK